MYTGVQWRRVGIGERMSGKEFCENQKFKMAVRDSFSMKK
jgi:hypothetical protein